MNLQELVVERGYVAFVLSDESKQQVLRQFPPSFPDVYAHHVTLEFNVTNSYSRIVWYEDITVNVIGYKKGAHIETLLVTVDGKRKKPTGDFYHLTLSLDRSSGKCPKDSNELLRKTAFKFGRKNLLTLKGTVQFIPFNH